MSTTTPGETSEQVVERVINALADLNRLEKAGQVKPDAGYDAFLSYLYTPHPGAKAAYAHLKDLLAKKAAAPKADKQSFDKDLGRAMECIAALMLSRLRYWSTIKNMSSMGPQYDLVIGGDSPLWEKTVQSIFPNKKKGHCIVVEAKAEEDTISEAQMSRVCSLLADNLSTTAFMGIFFSIKGIGGLSKKGDPHRTGSLRYGYLKQVLFFVKKRRPIIVLDQADLDLLIDKEVNLVKLLRAKVRDLEQLSGIATADVLKPEECPNEVDLPTHLKAALGIP